MELEDDLKRLRFAEAPTALRRRILHAAEAAARPRSLVPPWIAAIERHWLYPGRKPALALALAWLLIASLRFSTPARLLPGGGRAVPLTQQDIARFEYQRGELLAALRELENEPPSPPNQPNPFPPRG
jgi:hypothetical protein